MTRAALSFRVEGETLRETLNTVANLAGPHLDGKGQATIVVSLQSDASVPTISPVLAAAETPVAPIGAPADVSPAPAADAGRGPGRPRGSRNKKDPKALQGAETPAPAVTEPQPPAAPVTVAPAEQAAPTAPAPAAHVPTKDDARQALHDLVVAQKIDLTQPANLAVDVLARFGCKKLSDVPADRYGDFIAACKDAATNGKA